MLPTKNTVVELRSFARRAACAPCSMSCIGRAYHHQGSCANPRTQRQLNGLALAEHSVSYCADLRLPFSRPGFGFFGVAAIPAARSFAIRLISFTGTGLASVKWI